MLPEAAGRTRLNLENQRISAFSQHENPRSKPGIRRSGRLHAADNLVTLKILPPKSPQRDKLGYTYTVSNVSSTIYFVA